ncbi:hypothetical protein F4780DRAFT_797005 [Xylariomycetidae sp. FL0641]|nr:hypothetical protein F4780DRAFT_797005 [Xylariomycetidae sp. FL0641]
MTTGSALRSNTPAGAELARSWKPSKVLQSVQKDIAQVLAGFQHPLILVEGAAAHWMGCHGAWADRRIVDILVRERQFAAVVRKLTRAAGAPWRASTRASLQGGADALLERKPGPEPPQDQAVVFVRVWSEDRYCMRVDRAPLVPLPPAARHKTDDDDANTNTKPWLVWRPDIRPNAYVFPQEAKPFVDFTRSPVDRRLGTPVTDLYLPAFGALVNALVRRAALRGLPAAGGRLLPALLRRNAVARPADFAPFRHLLHRESVAYLERYCARLHQRDRMDRSPPTASATPSPALSASPALVGSGSSGSRSSTTPPTPSRARVSGKPASGAGRLDVDKKKKTTTTPPKKALLARDAKVAKPKIRAPKKRKGDVSMGSIPKGMLLESTE